MFISFEGIDGSGKGTQIDLLKKYFEKKNIIFEYYREPGSTQVGEALREVVLGNKNLVSDFTEVMLYATARAQLVEEKIMPALKNGVHIICDRYVDSSVAYQSVRNVPKEDILTVNNLATRGILPDLTFLIDVEASVGLSRVLKQTDGDRIEQEGKVFFENVVNNYRTLAKENQSRVITINGEKDIEEIHIEIINHIENFL
ncbi:MAG: dTMP kinase [Lachnospirales bacterium]